MDNMPKPKNPSTQDAKSNDFKQYAALVHTVYSIPQLNLPSDKHRHVPALSLCPLCKCRTEYLRYLWDV